MPCCMTLNSRGILTNAQIYVSDAIAQRTEGHQCAHEWMVRWRLDLASLLIRCGIMINSRRNCSSIVILEYDDVVCSPGIMKSCH
jgi:hypothetical protein